MWLGMSMRSALFKPIRVSVLRCHVSVSALHALRPSDTDNAILSRYVGHRSRELAASKLESSHVPEMK